MNMVYWKHYEREADRFACQNASDRKELETAKEYFLLKIQIKIDNFSYGK